MYSEPWGSRARVRRQDRAASPESSDSPIMCRGRTPGLPRGGDEQRSLPRRVRLPRRHTAVGLISGDLLTSRGASSGSTSGRVRHVPERRRRATSRLSFCARPNRRSSARTPHSSLRPTSHGASSSAWRRAGSPRPGRPQPPSAARRSAEPRASPAAGPGRTVRSEGLRFTAADSRTSSAVAMSGSVAPRK